MGNIGLYINVLKLTLLKVLETHLVFDEIFG